MYTREEKKQNRINFWSKLEDDLADKRNPFGTKVNWMNYNTGFNDIYFRMEADENGARLCIDIQFNDPGIRELFYEQFVEFETILESFFKKNLLWYRDFEHSNGKTISRLMLELSDSNILSRNDWDKMHLFLKLNFIKLDKFWCEYGEVFKNLK